ncbi:glucose-6-phosphate isomerase, partial [Psychromonas aquatilis]
KNLITEEIFTSLLDLDKEVDLVSAIKAQFSGEKINITEGLAVLHTAISNRSNSPDFVDGEDVMPKINEVL